jgi:hypothetical protein
VVVFSQERIMIMANLFCFAMGFLAGAGIVAKIALYILKNK